MDKEYRLKILPLFEEDLTDIVDYISNKLHNQKAANQLIDDVEAALLSRLSNPLAFEKFESVKKRKYDYYRIRIRNFTIFYVVIDDIMEVRRIIYNKRDLINIL